MTYHSRMSKVQAEVIARAVGILGSQLALARALGIKPPTVHQWLSGKRPVPAERCPSIERLTGGAVLCEQLRPDVEWGFLRKSSQQWDGKGVQ